MLVSLFGKQYRKSIGIGVPVKFWNASKKRAKVTAEFNGTLINDQIEQWRQIGTQVEKHFAELKIIPTQSEFNRILSELSEEYAAPTEEKSQRNCAEIYFCDYFEHIYIPRYSIVREKLTVIKYSQALHKLQEFEQVAKKHFRIIDINIDFYNQFQQWFFQKGYSRNYFGAIIKIIKQVYRESRVSDRLHNEYGTDHRDFIAPKEATDSIYLNITELDRIHSLDITDAVHRDKTIQMMKGEDNSQRKIIALERTRGLFLIGCYTGLRVSDFSRLTEAHIGEYITIKTHKTGTPVVIPIHPRVRAILDNGLNLGHPISGQKLNEQIKELCRLAGIDEEITVNKNVSGKNIEVRLPKYKLISSHTARRSFATNAYKAGVPSIAIMKITGHTKESTFLKYIRVSSQENAEILSSHPFFSGRGI